MTALFCDLVGYTAWNEEDDPERVVQVMDRIKLGACAIFEQHGGIANQFVGDEILGLFGVVTSHEDDPVRAVSAALALHTFVREQEVLRENGTRRALDMHTGIESGRILVRSADYRAGACDVVGNEINLAARLRALAESGEILVGPATRERLAGRFRLEAKEPVMVRGKAQPVTPYRVLGWAERESLLGEPVPQDSSQLVGRETVMQALQDSWRAACAGEPSLVTIAGPAGIGKSRLVRELRRWLSREADSREARILYGRCLAYGSGAPYQPFIDALRGPAAAHGKGDLSTQPLERIRAHHQISSATLATLAYLLAPEQTRKSAHPIAEGEPLREAILAALAEVITSSDQPALLILEDWHAADEPSQMALRQIAQHMTGRRLLIVVNRRADEGGAEVDALATRRIALEPLNAGATEQLAARILGSELSEGLSAIIRRRSLGNPFFVEEICRVLQDEGTLTAEGRLLTLRGDESQLRTPASVEAIVRSRISRLPLAQRRALAMAAVVGLDFGVDELEELWSRPFREQGPSMESAAESERDLTVRSLTQTLIELQNQGVINRLARGAYRFNHAITQAVAYGTMSASARRWYHGLIGERAERQWKSRLESHYELLAYHFGLSADRSKAIHYALCAADKAWRSHSLEQAAAQYRQAVETIDKIRPLDETLQRKRIQATISWARVDLYNPNQQVMQALATSQSLAQQLNDRQSVCLCLNWRSWIAYALGDYHDAFAVSQELVSISKTLESRALLGQAYNNVGLALAMATKYDEAVEAILQAIHTRGRSDGTANAYSHGSLALIFGDQGAFAEATHHLKQAAAIVSATAKITSLGPLLIQRAMVEIWKGDFAACVDTTRAARTVAERIGGTYIDAMSRALGGYAMFRLGEADRMQGIVDTRRACDALEDSAIRLHLSFCYALLADAQALAGRFDDAHQSAQRALARAAVQDALGEVTALRVLATIALRKDHDRVLARELSQRALQAARMKRSQRELAMVQRFQAELG